MVVGVDGSRGSGAAVAWAAELGRVLDARVSAVHVVSTAWEWEMSALQVDTEPMIRERRRNLMGGWTEPLRNAGVVHATRFLEGHPARKLLEVASGEGGDLLVIGSSHHGRVYEMVFGSLPHELVTKAPCPVVLVPAVAPASAGAATPLRTNRRATSRAAV